MEIRGSVCALLASVLLPVAAAAQTPAAAGTYRLVQVNDGALPVTVEEEDDCVERVTAGTLTLGQDGTWQVELTEVETCGTEVDEDSEREDGRYTVAGNAIDFRPDDDDDDDGDAAEMDLDELLTGTIAGNDIRVVLRDAGVTAVFRRVQGQ